MSTEPIKGKSSENISKLVTIGKKIPSFDDDDEPQTHLRVKDNERLKEFSFKVIKSFLISIYLEKAVFSVSGHSIFHL